MRRAASWVLVFALVTGACASAPAPRAAAPSAEGEKPAGGEAQYERILGSFTIAPEALILLDPELARDHLEPEWRSWRLAGYVESFREVGFRRGQAVASLDLGAVAWVEDRPEAAYAAIVDARDLFAELGDVQGLAHAYEWLGWMLVESGDVPGATEHLAVAFKLYKELGDEDAAARVLRYAE